MPDEQTVTPAPQPEVPENVTEEAEKAPEHGQEIDNQTVVIPKEKLEDYKRKLTGSKAEALRLKAENERLTAEHARLVAEAEAARSGQSQSYGFTGYQSTPAEIALFKQLAAQAGVPLKEELAQAQAVQDTARYNEVSNQQLQDFLTRHPEYANPGDPNSDNLWIQLDATLKEFNKPAKAEDYGKLLEKAHKLVKSDDIDMAIEKGKALGLAQATIAERGKIGGLGGGSSGGTRAPVKKSPEKQSIEEGFASVRPNYFS